MCNNFITLKSRNRIWGFHGCNVWNSMPTVWQFPMELYGTFKVAANCQKCAISVCPSPFSFGLKILGEKVGYCQSLPSYFLLLGASYSV